MGTTAKRNDLPVTIKYSPFDTYGFHFIHCNRVSEVKEAMFVIVNKEGVKASYILK